MDVLAAQENFTIGAPVGSKAAAGQTKQAGLGGKQGSGKAGLGGKPRKALGDITNARGNGQKKDGPQRQQAKRAANKAPKMMVLSDVSAKTKLVLEDSEDIEYAHIDSEGPDFLADIGLDLDRVMQGGDTLQCIINSGNAKPAQISHELEPTEEAGTLCSFSMSLPHQQSI
eukprot:SAG31_NODE_1361_length_8631_cov_3.401899_3_plen_171_part_00